MFKLLRYFSLASLVAIIIATIALTTLYERLAVRDLIDGQEQHHVALTRVVANTMWPQFSAFVSSSKALSNDALKSHPEIARLHKAVLQELNGMRVLKVKIYDLAGRTVFSSEAKQIGEDKSENAGFLSALSGKPASELTHRNQFSAFEQTVSDIDVVSSYIPIYRKDSTDVEGVFEIYSDISSLLRRVHETRNAVIFQVSAVLLALYAVLFFIVRHADAMIKRQEAQRRQDEERLREARNEIVRSEEFHRSLIERSSNAVVILNADLTVRYATVTLQRVTGMPESEVMGAPLAVCASESERGQVECWLAAVAARPDAVQSIEFQSAQLGRDTRYLEAVATNMLGHFAVEGIVVNIRDITERKNAEMEIRRLAHYDSLTGLSNRESFKQFIGSMIARSERHGESFAILFLDLDRFKDVNDTLGHNAGDALLKEVAIRVSRALRESDSITRSAEGELTGQIARLGGDEFTILLNNLSQPEDAAAVARRILETLAKPYTVCGKEVTITGSLGIAVCPKDGSSMESLLQHADAAMYRAKSQGKNNFQFYTDSCMPQ